jgi:2-oxoglutarate ferredoxin oxidoreductase subunit beta
MAVIHKYLRTNKKFPHVWCAGCSNGIVLAALVRAIDRLKLDRDEIVLVSGIGCSSRAPVNVDFNTLHTTHGRALAFATGVKLANPKFHVIVITGDGDALAIGGNHFLHTCRRNLDITILIFNNYIYGMTGGQQSPTTPFRARTSTSQFGAIDNPFPICDLSIAAGATFVARGTGYHAHQLDGIIEKAIRHKGCSVVEIMSNCPVIYGRYNRLGSAVDMLRWQKENSMPVSSWNKVESQAEREQIKQQKIITGILYEVDKVEYTEQYQKLIEAVREKELATK